MDEQLTRLSDEEVSRLKLEYPTLPSEYFDHLVKVGWGTLGNGCMVYSGPGSPDDVYLNFDNQHVVLLGDDFQGYCFGFDLSKGTFGEFSPRGKWEEWDDGKGFSHYVS